MGHLRFGYVRLGLLHPSNAGSGARPHLSLKDASRRSRSTPTASSYHAGVVQILSTPTRTYTVSRCQIALALTEQVDRKPRRHNETPFDMLAEWLGLFRNQGDRIRTCDLVDPNHTLYQAELHPGRLIVGPAGQCGDHRARGHEAAETPATLRMKTGPRWAAPMCVASRVKAYFGSSTIVTIRGRCPGFTTFERSMIIRNRRSIDGTIG